MFQMQNCTLLINVYAVLLVLLFLGQLSVDMTNRYSLGFLFDFCFPFAGFLGSWLFFEIAVRLLTLLHSPCISHKSFVSQLRNYFR